MIDDELAKADVELMARASISARHLEKALKASASGVPEHKGEALPPSRIPMGEGKVLDGEALQRHDLRVLLVTHLRKLRTAQKYHTQRLLHLITDKPKSRKAFAEWEQSNHGTLQLIHAEEDKIDELLEELAKLES